MTRRRDSFIWIVAVVTACSTEGASASREGGASSPGAGAVVARFTTVRSWPHDPTAFTQGLDFHEGKLYEGTGLEGKSTLREVALETGAVTRKVDLPATVFGEGITVLGDRIYQVTWKAQKGYVYDRATFRKLREFEYAGAGWGLTHDGQSLIMSDGTSLVKFIDPATFAVQRTVTVKDGAREVPSLNELEMVNGELYANVWDTNSIVRIDPATGSVIGWINLEGIFTDSDKRRYLKPGQQIDVLNGIAFDEQTRRLFVTGKWWPRLYEITVDSTG
jgi:glutamine cyclotransferase